MATRVMTTADGSAQVAISVDFTARTTPVDKWIGGRVRVRRTSRGMSQQEFCKLLGLSRNDLPAYEAGAQRINANLLLRIAKSLDVRPDYFFRGYVQEQPKAI
jgi:DNA-binding XRE family transcriptional regulator